MGNGSIVIQEGQQTKGQAGAPDSGHLENVSNPRPAQHFADLNLPLNDLMILFKQNTRPGDTSAAEVVWGPHFEHQASRGPQTWLHIRIAQGDFKSCSTRISSRILLPPPMTNYISV